MSKFTDELSGFLSLLNPWAGLILQAVSMVETLAAQAPVKPAGSEKLAAALGAVTTGITALSATSTEAAGLATAIKTGDPATVTAGLTHATEMALSIAKAFGLFPKAGIVQAAAPLMNQNVGS